MNTAVMRVGALQQQFGTPVHCIGHVRHVMQRSTVPSQCFGAERC